MSWKPETYKASQIDEMIRNKEITTPRYQRGSKWSEEQRESLIDSIKRGFPFGSILLDKKTAENGVVTYDLIDGLQRCTTINKFLNNPGLYFKDDDIEDEFVHKIYELMDANDKGFDKNETEDEIRNEIVNYVQDNLPNMEDVKSIQYYEISSFLKKKWVSLSTKIDDLNHIVEDLFKAFKKTCTDLTDAEIPAIVYDGDQSLLPEVFERINSKGTTLSKYDIYSASWGDDGFSITDSDFRSLYDFICKRYEEMNDSDVCVSDFDSSQYKKDKSINTFDLCFSFGKQLKQKFPTLFGGDSDSITVDSVGFNLINSCIGKPASELPSLNVNLKPFSDKIQILLRRIIDSCVTADGYLKVITTLKGNSTKSLPILHSENQIISIVTSIFFARFANVDKDDDDKIASVALANSENETWASKKSKFETNIPVVYVEDSLSNSWSGTGDKKLYNVICDLGYYSRNFDEADFDSVYNNWFNNICRQRNEEKSVRSPTSTDKIILNIYTAQTVTAMDAYNNKPWDIEHICPKKQMKEALMRLNASTTNEEDKLKLPISSIGNVCYLPSSLNRSKEEKTIYQAGLSQDDLLEVETKFALTEKTDLDWLSDTSLSAEDFKNSYYSFINKRGQKILSYVKEFLFHK